ncbi:hypothetical protein TRIUR3_07953 [Triticum urartu]|uniref:Uncharacterized protein n=1 Tax=Triticum urartu TaxID=4572 RepID=M7ZL87_TRIUA|nr:hypothetical protein TRIUR3_07953 [Triticum urartu]
MAAVAMGAAPLAHEEHYMGHIKMSETRRTRWVMHYLSKVNGGVPVPKEGLPKDGMPVTNDEVPTGGV